MARILAQNMSGAFPHVPVHVESRRSAAHQAYQFLHVAFVVMPILAGIDKFLHFLTEWDMYLSPRIAALSPIGGHNLMLVAGVIEIIAGLIVLMKPRVGAYIVTVWLFAIVANLLLMRGFYDIALRDFGLALSALALGRLSGERDIL